MKLVQIILFAVLFLSQEPELETEFEPIEIYNIVLILLGVLLIIISSRINTVYKMFS